MVVRYIAGTFIGLLLILAVAYWINSKRLRHSSQIRADTPQQSDSEDGLAAMLNRPIVWGVIFFAFLAAVAVGTITVLTDPFGLEIPATLAIGGLFGVLFVGFITYNVYSVARNRGHSSALSIAESLAVFVLFAFVLVAVVLVTG